MCAVQQTIDQTYVMKSILFYGKLVSPKPSLVIISFFSRPLPSHTTSHTLPLTHYLSHITFHTPPHTLPLLHHLTYTTSLTLPLSATSRTSSWSPPSATTPRGSSRSLSYSRWDPLFLFLPLVISRHLLFVPNPSCAYRPSSRPSTCLVIFCGWPLPFLPVTVWSQCPLSFYFSLFLPLSPSAPLSSSVSLFLPISIFLPLSIIHNLSPLTTHLNPSILGYDLRDHPRWRQGKPSVGLSLPWCLRQG